MTEFTRVSVLQRILSTSLEHWNASLHYRTIFPEHAFGDRCLEGKHALKHTFFKLFWTIKPKIILRIENGLY